MKKQSLAWVLALALILSSSFAALAVGEQFLPQDKEQALDWAVDALFESVFKTQYDNGSSNFMVRWEIPLRVYMSGDYTRGDLAVTERFVRDVGQLVTWLPDIRMASSADSANIFIEVAKLDELPSLGLPGYSKGDWASFSYWFDEYKINRAQIVLASDVTTQEDRNYLILMQLTGVLGLTGRITSFSDSVITSEWSVRQNLSWLDWLMLNLLYEPRLYPGISGEEARSVLKGSVSPEDRPQPVPDIVPQPAPEEALPPSPEAVPLPAPTEESVSGEMQPLQLTLEELALYNGQDGQPAYIAVDGIIYDVTNSGPWQDGQHNGYQAGKDLTQEIKNVSPHGVGKLNNVVEVGIIIE